MDYYIDGTIDSIEIAMDENQPLHFLLIPSSEFLKTMVDGSKKALFIAKKYDSALLEGVVKNEKEKEALKFEISNADCSLKCLLLEAKNNRNTVRVSIRNNLRKLLKKDDAIVALTALLIM